LLALFSRRPISRAGAAGSLGLASVLFLAALLLPVDGRAEQPRDWMVGPQPGGTYLNVDVIFPGAQLLIEHRVPINGLQNELALRANSLITAPFYESQADIDMRIVVFTLGASLGFNDTFRGLIFRPDEPLDQAYRRQRDFAGDYEEMDIWFGEGRFNVSIPFNDYLLWHNVNYLRYEDRPDRSFDWRLGLVHDGFYLKSDFHLFFKHRSFGALAPLVQLVDFRLDGEQRTVLNYGFFFVTRPGFRRRDDILLITMLFNFGKTLGDYDAQKIYGIHSYHAPLTFLLAYRMVFDLDE
jgi:hypothetical protein